MRKSRVIKGITLTLMLALTFFAGVISEAKAGETNSYGYSYVEQAKEYLDIDVAKVSASDVDKIVKGVEHTFTALSTNKITSDISDTNKQRLKSMVGILNKETREILPIPEIKGYKTYLMDNETYFVKVWFTYCGSQYTLKATTSNGVVYTSNLDWLFNDIYNTFYSDSVAVDDEGIVDTKFESAEPEIEESTTGFIKPLKGE